MQNRVCYSENTFYDIHGGSYIEVKLSKPT